MTNPNYTALLFIIDRSGSMSPIKDDMEGGIKTLLEDQKEIDGDVTVDFAYFDTEFIYDQKLASLTAAAPKIVPRGGTALYDAIVRASVEFGESLAAMEEDKRPGKVLVAIVTDGYENSSRESTIEDVKKVIETQQNDYSWQYIFLGANQDAIMTAKSFGMARGSAMTFDYSSAGAHTATRGMSNYISGFRQDGKAEFSEDQSGEIFIDGAITLKSHPKDKIYKLTDEKGTND